MPTMTSEKSIMSALMLLRKKVNRQKSPRMTSVTTVSTCAKSHDDWPLISRMLTRKSSLMSRSMSNSRLPKKSRVRIGQISAGKSNDEALDIALQQVNNVSKRKLLGSIEELYQKAMHIEPRFVANNGRPFFEEIEKEAVKYLPNANVYSGFYLSYSRSSFCDGLKIEPYLISTLADGETMPRVYCQSMSGEYYIGTGIFSPCQVGYLLFNEQKRLQLALKVIYLQLPMLEYPSLITGLYLTHDYSRNPIARRILLVRQSEEIPLEEFAKLRTEVVPASSWTKPFCPTTTTPASRKTSCAAS